MCDRYEKKACSLKKKVCAEYYVCVCECGGVCMRSRERSAVEYERINAQYADALSGLSKN